MATAPKLDIGTDIVLAVEETPQIVLLDSAKFDQFYERVKAETESLVVDLSTKKGRDAIIAMAAKVTKSKTAIDKARLLLTSERREEINQINGVGKEITTRLDALAKDVRQPVTEWEEAEKARIDRCNEIISDIMGAAIVTLEDTSETVRERGMKVWAIEIGEDFGALAHDAERAKSATVSTLQAALARLKQEEADKAELEKLRAEAAAREEAERLAAEKAAQVEAAKEAARREAEEEAAYEERRIAAEKADAERVERARQEAAEAARREAEAAKQAEIDAANERARLAEEAAQRQRDEAAQAERERIAQQEAEAAEQARKEKSRAHRAQIMGEAKIAIMAAGSVDEAAAVAIVKAIVNSSIPHVTLRF